MKENTKTVFNYLKEHDGEKIIAADIAEATGLPIKSVNGIVTAALCRKGKDYAERIPGAIEVQDEEGHVMPKAVKFIQLTDKGRESTVESIEAEELAAAQAKLAAKNAE
jgi:hypothetical protein